MFPFPFSFVAPTASGLADIDNVYSMEFDGVNDYFETNLNLSSFSSISISCWINLASVSGNQSIISQYQNSTPASSSMWILTIGTQIWFLFADGGSFAAAKYTSTLQTGLWYNVTGTYDGTTIKIYVNGVLGSVEDTLSGINASSLPLLIGAVNNASNSGKEQFFNGSIDELAIFDYALDADQIDEIYNATSTGKTADLSTMATPPVAWYRMGD